MPHPTPDTFQLAARRLLDDAIAKAGSVDKLSRTFNYRTHPTRTTLFNWRRGTHPIPADALAELQRRADQEKP
jgi:hypothetical protein